MFSKFWHGLFRTLIRGTALFLLFLGMAMAGSSEKGESANPMVAAKSLSVSENIPTRIEVPKKSKAEQDREVIAEKMVAPPQSRLIMRLALVETTGASFIGTGSLDLMVVSKNNAKNLGITLITKTVMD